MAVDDGEIVLDYTARDFEAIRSLLVGVARGTIPEWVTVGEANDFGTLLLELYAYMGDITNYYIDRVSAEAFLGTAQRRQSILYMAEMLGYKPLGQRAAAVELVFELSPDYTGAEGETSLVIPAGTAVRTGVADTLYASDDEGDIYFETDYDVTIEAGHSVTVTATEGQTYEQYLGSSQGVPNAGYPTTYPGVIEGTIKVQTLEGEETVAAVTSPRYIRWYEVQSVASARPAQSVYSTILGDDGYTIIVFGDNSSGRIPPIGAGITATYRYGVGAAANSVNPNEILVISSTFPGSSQLTVRNPSSPQGGSDVETSESMRFSIPRSRQVRSRAVTLQDFKNLVLQVPGINKALAYGEIYSSVTVRIAAYSPDVSSDGFAILRARVQDFLSERVLIGAQVFVENVQFQDVYVKLNVNVLDGFDAEATQVAVESSINSLFDYSQMDFGQAMSLGEVYRAALKVYGVDYVTVSAYNGTSLDDSVAMNRVVPKFNEILRIHPAGEDPLSDPYGLLVETTGGTD